MNFLPLMNTDEIMSEDMFNALNILEARFVLHKTITKDQAVEFLSERYGSDLASRFKPEFLYLSQE